MFIAENIRLRQQHSEDTTEFLAQQLADAKKRLDDQDEKVRAFKSRYLGSLPDQEQTNLNILMGLTSQLDAATQALSRAQQDKSFAQSNLNQALDAWQGRPERPQSSNFTSNNSLSCKRSLRNFRRGTRTAIRMWSGRKTILPRSKRKSRIKGKLPAILLPRRRDRNRHSSPRRIQRLRAQIHILDQMIAEKTREQEEVKRQIKEYQGRVQSSPSVEQEYTELTRGYQTALDTYHELEKKRDQAAMATNLERRQEGEQFTVLDPANLPDRPSFPNRPLVCARRLRRRVGSRVGAGVLSGNAGHIHSQRTGR